MPSLSRFAQVAVLLGSVASVSAFPGNMRPRMIEIRQASASVVAAAAATPTAAAAATAPSSPAAAASAAAAASGLTDVDILQL
jgi:hypothetical protein